MASKLLFIDSSVPEKEILIDNIDNDDVIIVSDSNSLKDIELDNISNIGFVWKNYWIGTVKPHFPYFNYPVERPVGNQQGNDNELVLERKTIKEIAGNFPELKNIDLITCNLKEDGEWKDAFDELKGLMVKIDGEDVSVNVRYSINRTGSATLQGDWILESHSINILDEYFANKYFVYNHHLAPSDVQEINDVFLMNYPEFSIIGNTLNLNGDINIDGASWKTLIIENEVIIDSESVKIDCIDGNGHTITFTGMSNTIESLFFNGTGLNNSNNLRELIIKNLIVDGDTGDSFKGIMYSESNCPAQQVVVKNCSVENLQINDGYGAIFGHYAGYGQDNYVKAIACYSTGNITATNGFLNGSGGIYGSFAGSVLGSAYAIACYSTGNITTLSGELNGSGGIYGSFAGDGRFNQNVGGLAYAIACYSTGDITTDGIRNGCGGIFGSQAAVNNGLAYTVACYSTGDIITSNTDITYVDNGCGGIYGSGTGADGLVYAIACYSTGNITTNIGKFNGSGGIYGSNAGISAGIAYSVACYSTGEVTTTGGSKNGCGGIYGSNAGDNGLAYAIGCYSTGRVTTTVISNNGSGGIYGSNTGSASGIVYSVACYSTGSIGNTDANLSGYLYGTTNLVNINAVETFAKTINGWERYIGGSGDSESYDPLTPPITPDTDLFYYDNMIMPEENQLELRFFRSLPWDPRSPIPQRPFLLDWSTCDFEQVFYDDWFKTTDAWYINNDLNFTGSVDIIWARKLLTNLDNSNTLDTFMPLPDYIPVNTIILGEIAFDDIQLYDMVYVDISGTIVQVTDLSGNMVNGMYPSTEDFYRVNTQFPINSEFNDNMDIMDPFLKNFVCVEEYDIAKRNWDGFNICETTLPPQPTNTSPIKWVTIEGSMYGNRRF